MPLAVGAGLLFLGVNVTLDVASAGAIEVEAQPGFALAATPELALPPVVMRNADRVVRSRSRNPREGSAEGGPLYRLEQRRLPNGVEDLLWLDRAPEGSRISYRVAIGPRVAGLRLVGRVLELLDAGGVPRLRMVAPWLEDATGRRMRPTVEVEGCAVDRSPAPPRGRAVTNPGARSCQVAVRWAGLGVTYPLLVDPLWTTTDTLAEARHSASAVFVGGGILVSGGTSPGGDLASSELLDLSTGSWSASWPLLDTRSNHEAVALGPDGPVLVVGGERFPAAPPECELLDLSSGASGTGAMNEGRTRFQLALLDDGRVLAMGGYRPGPAGRLATTELYSQGTGLWSPGPELSGSRSRTSAAKLLDGRVLLAGGAADTPSGASNLAEIFDPVGNTWTPAPFVAERIKPEVLVLSDGHALLVGGEAGGSLVTQTELFDPSAGTWSTLADAPRGRRNPHLFEPVPGQILVATGETDGGASPLVDLLDVSANSWSDAGELSRGRTSAMAVSAAGSWYLIGGCAGSGCGAAPIVGVVDRFTPEPRGTSCSHAWECETGFCADGVCCDSRCNGECQSCDASGACIAVQDEDDLDTCAGAFTCSAAGACLRRVGSDCLLDNECSTGSCRDGVCCSTDCGDCERCVGSSCEPLAECTQSSGGVGGAAGSSAAGAAPGGSAGSPVGGQAGVSNPTGGTAGSAAVDGTGGVRGVRGNDSSCGCRAPARQPAPATWAAWLLVLWARRRRASPGG